MMPEHSPPVQVSPEPGQGQDEDQRRLKVQPYQRDSTLLQDVVPFITTTTSGMAGRQAWSEMARERDCTFYATVGLQLEAIQVSHRSLDPGVHRLPVLPVDVGARREALGAQLLQARVQHLAAGAEVRI